MKWNNVKPDIMETSISDVTASWSAIEIVELISCTTEHPLVRIGDDLRGKIRNHLKSDNVELGGLLLGSVVSVGSLSEGIVLVDIKDSIECRDFSATSVSLTMSSEVWQSANQSSTTKIFVVGWYHSHPDLGAFFSSVDRKTQSDFFNSAYNLGLVVDPIRNEEKWFLGKNSTELNPSYITSDLSLSSRK